MYHTMIIIFGVIRCVVLIVNFMLLIRAFLSWFPPNNDKAFSRFIVYTTDALTTFVRKAISGNRKLRDCSIDLSILFSSILLNILLIFL